ncbi:MAG: ImmA/IrrE family metallo-endopeptidase [Nitrospirae bacterium]|nr:ImmA/IrrE family metallo-endopeptidase [Nitrospirota bacterium]
MKIGTRGFKGQRLVEARKARGLSVIALSELTGLSRAAIYQYENNEQAPRGAILEQLSKILHIPEAYFTSDLTTFTSNVIFYRSMSSATKTARERAESRFLWLKLITSYLRQYIGFPIVNLPAFSTPNEPVKISNEEIEKMASESRKHWNLGDGPISDTVNLLERNGVIVARDTLDADTLDAFSEYYEPNATPYIVLGDDKKVSVRSRFDACHELAHLILHSKIKKDILKKTPEFKLIEAQANYYAGAFLLPAHVFAKEFYTVNMDLLKKLKLRWRVSIKMMIKRAFDLNLVSSDQARNLYINYSKRKWSMQEPYDNELIIEQPLLIRKAFELLLNKSIAKREDVFSNLPLPQKDIESLAGLTSGFLSVNQKEIEPNIYIITSVNSNKPRELNATHPVNIIPFKKRD